MGDINSVGVIGAGQMGSGIAHVCALGGREVKLHDQNTDRLKAALEEIEKNLTRQASRSVITEADAKAALARISPTSYLAEVGQVDLVIEAAITRLAASTDRPERFIGLHFMNPAPVMKLVEIIRGIATARATYETVKVFAESLGKTTTDAEDYPAFIVNRILVPMINEAIYALYEGVGDVRSIDTSLRLGANHPMGPLELGDFMGLDVVLAIMNVLHDGMSDTKYRPCPLLVKYVEAGWLGRKTGRGFYDYSGPTPEPTR
jgi:3-hydroxybutyryl-CoA dehydrogenase